MSRSSKKGGPNQTKGSPGDQIYWPPDKEEDLDESDFLSSQAGDRNSISLVVGSNNDYSPSTNERDHVETREFESDKDSEIDFGFSPRRQSPLKRSAPSPPHPATERPFKRVRGGFNQDYLNLLNADIQDAAARFVAREGVDLAASQVGLVHWTPEEKELFFEAVGRLGPDEVAGIAARIKTKCEFEVAQYLQRIHSVALAQGQKHGNLNHLVPVDFPAAVELSQVCCSALEEAADALSVRQETFEESVEKKRWGEHRWLITEDNYQQLEIEASKDIKSVELFRVGLMLRLSSEVFMNAAFSEFNWRGVSDEPPAIRTTALEDLYSLVVSVTRRLVAATIFVAESRFRAKPPRSRNAVKEVLKSDSQAAVKSLGLPVNARIFWAKCPRRLRLNVYADHPPPQYASRDDDEVLPMTYDDVEAELGATSDDVQDRECSTGDESSAESDAVPLSATPSLDEADDLPANQHSNTEGEESYDENEDGDEGVSEFPHLPGTDDDAVEREARELLVFSRHDYLQSNRAKNTVKYRIRLAQAHENYANYIDTKASYREEKRMWALLGQPPPAGPERPRPADPLPSAQMVHRFDDLVYGSTPGSESWRESLKGVQAPVQWEVEAQIQTQERGRDVGDKTA